MYWQIIPPPQIIVGYQSAILLFISTISPGTTGKNENLMLVAIKSVYFRKGFELRTPCLVSISDLVSTFSSIRYFLPSFHKIGKNMA